MASAGFAGVMENPLPYLSPPFQPDKPLLKAEVFPMAAIPQIRPARDFSLHGYSRTDSWMLLVCFSARGLALIDQHAAHERVAFEKLRRQLNAGAVQKQSLLIPQPLS